MKAAGGLRDDRVWASGEIAGELFGSSSSRGDSAFVAGRSNVGSAAQL